MGLPTSQTLMMKQLQAQETCIPETARKYPQGMFIDAEESDKGNVARLGRAA